MGAGAWKPTKALCFVLAATGKLLEGFKHGSPLASFVLRQNRSGGTRDILIRGGLASTRCDHRIWIALCDHRAGFGRGCGERERRIQCGF